jgi:hypothetical protein
VMWLLFGKQVAIVLFAFSSAAKSGLLSGD